MIVVVEVGLATTRPPREDRTVFVVVSVDGDGLVAELEAKLLATHIAMGGSPLDGARGESVVMPVRSRIIEIQEI